MTSCDLENRCGTGTGTFVHPDDPNFNSTILTAKPAFGGIDLTWTYPEHNAHAVSHVIIYRSRNIETDTRVQHALVNGSHFFDRVPGEPTLYYYWVRFVSINGTDGPLIGPAHAVSKNQIDEVIEGLTGQITDGMLAPALNTVIGGIGENAKNLEDERYSRISTDGELSLAFSNVERNLTGVRSEIVNYTEEFRDTASSIVNSVDLLFSQTEGNQALILKEQTARATETEALSQKLTTVESNLGNDIAQVQTNLKTTIDAVDDISASYTTVLNVNGLIGGFGIGNDGTTVEAGFNVDRFWIGKLDNYGNAKGGKLPVIIEGNDVFIDDAKINKLTINKLRSDDGSLAFTPARYDYYGRLIEQSKLNADFIDASRIDASEMYIDFADISRVSVDTLQIKGSAITAPANYDGSSYVYLSSGITRYGVNTTWRNPYPVTVKVLVVCILRMSYTSASGYRPSTSTDGWSAWLWKPYVYTNKVISDGNFTTSPYVTVTDTVDVSPGGTLYIRAGGSAGSEPVYLASTKVILWSAAR